MPKAIGPPDARHRKQGQRFGVRHYLMRGRAEFEPVPTDKIDNGNQLFEAAVDIAEAQEPVVRLLLAAPKRSVLRYPIVRHITAVAHIVTGNESIPAREGEQNAAEHDFGHVVA